MPELPEVEATARDLAPVVGRRIEAVEKLDWPAMVEGLEPETFAAGLTGRRVLAVGRRAKWVLVTLDAGLTLAVHLRMSGSLDVYGPDRPADQHTHLVLALDDGRRVCFRDMRKFGRVRLLDAAGRAALEAGFGPEPLEAGFDADGFIAMLSGKRTRLKPLLLDQAFLAGLGNIYVDEALWHAGLHPLRVAGSLGPDEARRLHAAIRAVLHKALSRKGGTVRDYRTGHGEATPNLARFVVYDRKGKPCPRCGTPITRTVVGGRGTHVCPSCQRE